MTNIISKKIYVKSYGCQMNMYDSNRIKNLFEPKGYAETNQIENADLIVLNTCHIREKATEKVYSDIGRIKKIKKNDYKLVISGCVAQAEGEEIKKRAPSVNYIVGPQSYHKLPLMIEKNEEFINDDFLQNEKFQNLLFKSHNAVYEFISIHCCQNIHQTKCPPIKMTTKHNCPPNCISSELKYLTIIGNLPHPPLVVKVGGGGSDFQMI